MDLKQTIAGMAVRRPHVLVVEVPGWAFTRFSAERELRRRGWMLSSSPAESDILLTCGVPGPEFSEIIDRVWDQLPGPRVRADTTDPGQVPGVLDESRRALLDDMAQREDAEARTVAVPEAAENHDHGSGSDAHPDSGSADDLGPESSDGGQDDNDPGHGDMDHGDMDHEGMDHGDMDHGGMDHGGMDHGNMDMPMPGGIGLAEGGTDRDGLDLDVLHVPLGPVLPHWPAGLVVRCSLQGDVITDATVEVLPAAGSGRERSPVDEGLMRGAAGFMSAQYCDQAAGMLALLGSERLSVRALRLRDAVLDGAPAHQVSTELERLGRRIRRSRVLRWSVQDLPGVFERLLALLEGARTAPGDGVDADTAAHLRSSATEAGALERIPGLIIDLDVAGARLVIASLGLDTADVSPAESDHV